MHLDFFLKRRGTAAQRARRKSLHRRRAALQSEIIPRADATFLECLRLCVSPLHGTGTDTSQASA